MQHEHATRPQAIRRHLTWGWWARGVIRLIAVIAMMGALTILGCPDDDDEDAAPVAVDDTATTAEDMAVQINILANDTNVAEDDDDDDDDDEDEDTLAVTIPTGPTNGTATVNANNSVTYTPNANFNGQDTFTYMVDNRDGGTDTAMVTVTVTPVNDPPVAADDTATTEEEAAATINVLANDSDAEDDNLTVAIATQPTNGAAARNANNTVTYTPDDNFNGQDTFTYTVGDGNGGTDTATVTVTVTPVDDPAVEAAQVPEEVSNRAFEFANGNVFGIDEALGAATLTFGQFAGNTAPFVLEAGNQMALGMATLASCDLQVIGSTFEAAQGPQAGDQITLDPCLIDAQDNDALTVTNGGPPATSEPASASERIILPAVLDGDQEVADPPVVTDATGTGILTVNAGGDTIAFALTYQDIQTNVTMAHIHAEAQGVNGRIIFFLCADAPPAGEEVDECPEPSATLTGTLTAANFIESEDLTFAEAIEAISAGNTYFNVHSMTFPAGEVRGQIGDPTALDVSLSGVQEVPPADTDATGEATVLLNAGRSQITYDVTVTGIDDITVAHIHVGGMGVNGPPILFLCVDGEPPVDVPVPQACPGASPGRITGTLRLADLIERPADNINTFADAVTAILDGNAYINVHSVVFSGGEVRGQFPTPPPGE